MRVSVEQSGGFTGIPFRTAVDSETLSEEDGKRLRQLVEAAEFFNLPDQIQGSVYPDQFEYRLKVEENGRQHEIMVRESALTEQLRVLLDWVREAAGRGGTR